MSSLTKEINELAKALKSLTPLQPERQDRLDKKFRLEFSYNTNHIEGNTLTYEETKLLIIFGETKGNHQLREYEEMHAHDAAFALIREWARDKDHHLTETHIKNLNSVILVRPFWKEAITSDGQNTRRLIKVGDYKEQPNSVRLENGEIFHYPSPSETPMMMGDLMEWYHKVIEDGNMPPEELAALLHYKFVCIHPFDDGNGRISRLLMNYILLRNDLPPVIIKSADKKNYLYGLHQADAGDIDAFIHYIGQQVKWSLEISIKAAKGENIDEPGDLEKRLTKLKKEWGDDTTVRVTQKKDLDSIQSVIEKTLIPLAAAWQNKLEEFDPFLFSRRINVQFFYTANSNANKNLDGESFVDVLNTALNVANKNILYNYIGLACAPLGIRQLFDEINLKGGQIKLSFLTHFYRLEILTTGTIIQKIYNYSITEEEIAKVVDELGMTLLNDLEQNLEKKGVSPH